MSEPQPAAASDAPTNRRWLMFVLACGTSWFLYLHRYTWNLVGPELQEEFGFDNTELAGIFTAFSLPYTFGQVPSGILCDLIGPHLLLAVIIALWSVAMTYMGVPTGIGQLSMTRFAFGAAQAGAYPSLSKVTKVWFPLRYRTTVQGFIASFFGRCRGAMSSIIMGSLLIGYFGLNWRWALIVMSLAGLSFALAFLLLYRNRPEDHPQVNERELRLIREGEAESSVDRPVLPFSRVIRNRSMLVFIVQQFMNAGADVVYVMVMGAYFKSRGVNDVEAGLLISLPLWGGAFGGIAGGLINDGLIKRTGNPRWSRTAVGFTGKTLAAGMMFVAISQTVNLYAGIGLFVVKFFSDWTQPTVWGTCTDMGGKYSATVFSIINTAGGVGGIVTGLTSGALLDFYTTEEIIAGEVTKVTNFNPLFVGVAIMYLISASCWFLIDCTQSLDPPDELADDLSADAS